MMIGFWGIDNEEKKEFGFAHILLLILILVGMAAGVYLVQKPQIFKSKASLESISKFQVEVGEEEYVIGPTGAFLDNPFFTIQIPSGFRAFSANTNTYSFSGSMLNHLINEGLALKKGDNGYFDQCGAWLNSVYKLDENHWLGWYHGEKLTTCNYSQETVYQSMAFAESFDGGKTWSKPNYPLNQVLTGDNAFKSDGDKSSVGDAKVILFDNYFYMFYTAKTDWKMHLAKSPLEKGGKLGSWKKYYCSNANDVSSCGFTEDGLGGRSTAIAGGGSNFVSYNSYLNLFINISTWGKWGFLLKYSLPNDVTHWLNLPEMIFPLVSISDDSRVDDWVSVNRSSTGQVYGYSSIIGLDGNSDQSGKEFYLYYMKMFNGGDFNADRYLMKRRITLHNNANDPYYARVVLVRYEKTNPHKTKVSTEIAKPGTGYTKKDVLGYLLPYQADKFIPLYDCYIKEWDDYMVYSGDPSKVIAGESWRYCDSKGADFIRRIGYISQVKTNEASVPIYWCFDEQGLDHFMSTDPKCEGKKTVYLNGYLLSAPTDSSTIITPIPIPTATLIISTPSPSAVPIPTSTSTFSFVIEGVPLIRYEKDNPHKTRVTIDWTPTNGYAIKQALGYLSPKELPETTLFYECYTEAIDDYMITTLASDCNAGGVRLEKNIGYISKINTNYADTAIYRCFDQQNRDHFVSLDPQCEGKQTDWIIGYVNSQVNFPLPAQ